MLDFIELFPPADAASLHPLVADGFTTAQVRQAHAQGARSGQVHALGAWLASNLTVAGPRNFLFSAGVRMTGSSVVPTYVETLIADGMVDPFIGLDLPERVINEPTAVVVSWGQHVYGHAIAEAAPRVRVACRVLGKAIDEIAFLVPQSTAPWFREVLAFAGARRFIEYDQATEQVLLTQAIVPSLVMAVGPHPAAAELIADMRPQPSVGAGDALYVTRRGAAVTRAIHLLNADDIERVAERAGLQVINPERLPVANQAQRFADARLVVGEYGSGLMNAVFCHPGAIIAAIGRRSPLLSGICTLGGVRQSFFDPIEDPHTSDGYRVDADAFARWLDALLATSETIAEVA